jgi:hypothetical protein
MQTVLLWKLQVEVLKLITRLKPIIYKGFLTEAFFYAPYLTLY